MTQEQRDEEDAQKAEETRKASMTPEQIKAEEDARKAQEAEDAANAEGGKGSYKKRLTKGRLTKLTGAFTALYDVLKEIGVESLQDLAAVAKVEEAEGDDKDKEDCVTKRLAGLGIKADEDTVAVLQKRATELQQLQTQNAALEKRIADLVKVGIPRASGDDGVAVEKNKKPSAFKGVI